MSTSPPSFDSSNADLNIASEASIVLDLLRDGRFLFILCFAFVYALALYLLRDRIGQMFQEVSRVVRHMFEVSQQWTERTGQRLWRWKERQRKAILDSLNTGVYATNLGRRRAFLSKRRGGKIRRLDSSMDETFGDSLADDRLLVEVEEDDSGVVEDMDWDSCLDKDNLSQCYYNGGRLEDLPMVRYAKSVETEKATNSTFG